MTKKEILLDCIRLVYKINEFGSYVFVNISPHVKLTSFRFYNEGWEVSDHSNYEVNIYEGIGYDTYNHELNLGINTVEKLHEHLINLLEKKQNETNL